MHTASGATGLVQALKRILDRTDLGVGRLKQLPFTVRQGGKPRFQVLAYKQSETL